MEPGVPCPLSPRLLELLQAMADLRTRETQALADTLHCSRDTVRTYFQRIFAALEVHNRMEALFFAVDQGWVILDGSRAQAEFTDRPHAARPIPDRDRSDA